MKFRKDFVTNSSSSSFVMAFNTEDDYKEFVENCDFWEYNEFKDMVDRMIQNKPKEEAISKAIEILDAIYALPIKQEYIKKKFPGHDSMLCKDVKTYFEQEEEVRNSPEFQAYLKEKLKDTDYEEKKKRILSADILAEGMIWDNMGGILEWAIRNNFIRDNFKEYLVCQLDVG